MTNKLDSNKCDYTKLSLYKPGEFNTKHRSSVLSASTTMPIVPDEDFIKEINAVDSFLGGEYRLLMLTEDVCLYRVFGVYKNSVCSYGNGRLFATEFAESKIDVKMGLALLPEWNTRMYEERVIVPEGTKLYYGIAALQTRTEIDKETGSERATYYPGGVE